jgi:hypothetical protein
MPSHNGRQALAFYVRGLLSGDIGIDGSGRLAFLGGMAGRYKE